MKRIVKVFKSLEQAENFQDNLYNEYNSVQLVQAPLFSEDGTYIWEVKP